MLTMTHSTSLRVSPQVFFHRNCVLIIWEMRNAYYSKVLELMVNSRRVRPTCQMRTCSALPMDQTPSGDSSSLDFPPRYPRSLSSPSSPSSTPLSPTLHHSMDGEECEDGDITEPIASCTSLPPASPRENGRHEVSIQMMMMVMMMMMMMFHQNWHHRQMHYLHACTRAKILPTVAI